MKDLLIEQNRLLKEQLAHQIKMTRKCQCPECTNLESAIAEIEKKIGEQKDNETLYNEFGQWTKATFPNAGSVKHLIKLKEEVNEAIEAPNDIMEYADCMGGLFGAAYKAGFTFDDLFDAWNKKFQINKTRKWQVNKNGTYSHIKQ